MTIIDRVCEEVNKVRRKSKVRSMKNFLILAGREEFLDIVNVYTSFLDIKRNSSNLYEESVIEGIEFFGMKVACLPFKKSYLRIVKEL